MSHKSMGQCAWCKTKDCQNGYDCFGYAERHRSFYEVPEVGRLHKAATAIEARHYCKEPRIREIILFAKEMGYRKLGLAFCIGLAEEAQVVADILSREFEVVSICCKFCGIDKKSFSLEQIDSKKDRETMCNPAGQAALLNEVETEFNILCGLCVGHDAIFSMTSRAPVTTIITKDRVLANNPAGAVYSPYIRRTMLPNRDEAECTVSDGAPVAS